MGQWRSWPACNFRPLIKNKLKLISQCFLTQQGNCIKDLQTSVLYVNGRPSMVTLDYFISVDDEAKSEENVKKMHLDETVYK